MALSAQSPALFDATALHSLKAARVAIVATEWNEAIIEELMAGATKVLKQYGAGLMKNIVVPGAIEIPYACRLLAGTDVEAIIAFGAVIRGGTPHFEYVCQSVTAGLTQLNVTGKVPIIFGVLTLENEAQAWERLGGSHGHKGEEAALAALKMIALRRESGIGNLEVGIKI